MPTVAGAEWRTPTVQQILTSPRIAGLRALHGEVVAEAMWEPIITFEQREQLLRVFAAKRLSNRRAPQTYLLSGMLRCGRCGNKLFSSRRQDTRRYVCLSGPDHGGCGRLTVVAPPLEEWLAEAVLYRLDSGSSRTRWQDVTRRTRRPSRWALRSRPTWSCWRSSRRWRDAAK